MTAVDVLKNGAAPNAVLRDELVQAAFRQGLLLLGCGESAIRFCPPLCISAAQVETALRILDTILAGGGPLDPSGQNAVSSGIGR